MLAQTSTRRNLWRFLPGFVCLLAPTLLLWRVVFQGQVLYWGVPMAQFYPWQTLVNRALAAGQLPLWTDLLGAGAPLLANLQTGVFYLPNLLFRILPVEQALGFSVWLHLVGAGFAALFWGRTLGLNRLGQTVMALCYALGGYVVGRTQFITMVAAYAWLPLLLALTQRLVATRRRRDVAFLGMAVALQFLAGHAQLWFYSLVLVWLYGLCRMIKLWRRHDSAADAGRSLFLLAAGTVLGLTTAAAQLLPTVELALESQRAGGAEWDFAMTYSFWPWRLLTLVMPNVFGNPALGNYAGYANYWEDNAYLGILPLLFAALALFGWLKGRWRSYPSFRAQGFPGWSTVPFWAVLIPVAILLAMGKNTPVFPWVFRHVPGFGAFQAPARLMIWFSMGVATLAGIGAHRYVLTYPRQYVLRLTLAGSGATLLLALYAQRLTIPGIHLPAFVRLAVTLGLAAGVLLVGSPGGGEVDTRMRYAGLPRSIWAGLVVACLALDLLSYGTPLTPTTNSSVYQPLAGKISSLVDEDNRLFVDPQYEYHLRYQTYFLFDSYGPHDPTLWQGLRASGLPDINAVDGVPSLSNYDPLPVGRWDRLVRTIQEVPGETQETLLRTHNVGWVLTDSPTPSMVAVPEENDLYRLPGAAPRAWLVPWARFVSDGDSALAAVLEPGFDPFQQVVIEETAGVARPDTEPHQEDPSTWNPVDSLREGWNRRTIGVTASGPRYLVLSYTFYPGWVAKVDGQPVSLWRANYTQAALALDAGRHEVVLAYQPWWTVPGLLVSCLGLVACILLALPSRRLLREKTVEHREDERYRTNLQRA